MHQTISFTMGPIHHRNISTRIYVFDNMAHVRQHTRPPLSLRYPPPLRKHGRGPKSQVKTAVQRPPHA